MGVPTWTRSLAPWALGRPRSGSGVDAPVRGASHPYRLGPRSSGGTASGQWRPAARPSDDSPPASCPASRVARSPILDAVLSSRTQRASREHRDRGRRGSDQGPGYLARGGRRGGRRRLDAIGKLRLEPSWRRSSDETRRVPDGRGDGVPPRATWPGPRSDRARWRGRCSRRELACTLRYRSQLERQLRVQPVPTRPSVPRHRSGLRQRPARARRCRGPRHRRRA